MMNGKAAREKAPRAFIAKAAIRARFVANMN
jgi:hypothetical protein